MKIIVSLDRNINIDTIIKITNILFSFAVDLNMYERSIWSQGKPFRYKISVSARSSTHIYSCLAWGFCGTPTSGSEVDTSSQRQL